MGRGPKEGLRNDRSCASPENSRFPCPQAARPPEEGVSGGVTAVNRVDLRGVPGACSWRAPPALREGPRRAPRVLSHLKTKQKEAQAEQTYDLGRMGLTVHDPASKRR